MYDAQEIHCISPSEIGIPYQFLYSVMSSLLILVENVAYLGGTKIKGHLGFFTYTYCATSPLGTNARCTNCQKWLSYLN